MYQITKLCADAQRFVAYLAYGDRTRSLLTSLAVARVLSNDVQLPSGPVEDLEQFFKCTALIPMQTKLGALNELVVIDCDTILDYARRFYIVRYNTAFPPKKVFCPRVETAVEDFMGLSSALDPQAIEAIRSNPMELTKLYNNLGDLFAEMVL